VYINPSEKEELMNFLSQKFLEPSLTLSTHSLLTLTHTKTHSPSIATPTCFLVFQRNYCKSDLPSRFVKLIFYCVMQYFSRCIFYLGWVWCFQYFFWYKKKTLLSCFLGFISFIIKVLLIALGCEHCCMNKWEISCFDIVWICCAIFFFMLGCKKFSY